MHFARAFCLAVAALGLAGIASADSAVPLSEFAREHGLIATRDAVSGRDILKGGSTVIVAPGMSVALVDGRIIELSEPVRIEDGRTVVGREDISRLAAVVRDGVREPAPYVAPAPREKPAIVPAKPVPPLVKQDRHDRRPGRFNTIVLDPGHGGVHTGGKGLRGTLEKDITLDIALAVRDRLKEEGIRVVMTRQTDTQFSPEVREDLRRRAEFTNRTKPDLFLSVHVNWAENKGAQGFEVFYPRAGCEGSASERQTGRRLAEKIRETFANRFDTPDRGVKEAGYYVIKNAECPAVLVEVEFVSNVPGEKNLRDASYRKRLADAIADAVLAEHRR